MAYFDKYADDFLFDDDLDAQMAIFATQDADAHEGVAGPSRAQSNDKDVAIIKDVKGQERCSHPPTPAVSGECSENAGVSGECATEYVILTVEEIHELMNKWIDEVKTVVFLPSSVIRILLNRFKWDKQQLYDRYFEGEEQQAKLFEEAGMTNPNTLNPTCATKEKRAKMSCGICFTEYESQELKSMSCGHEYCLECWDQFLQMKLNQEDVCRGVVCPEQGCKTLVEDESMIELISSAHNKRKFKHLTTLTFMETNRLMRRCPSPSCYNAVKVNNREFVRITCNCGHSFCFLCGDDWHEPCSCELLVRWNKRCAGQSAEKIDCETANWILGNTKDCPKCKAPIEKNGGCNHMSCRNVSCRYEFCWLCMVDWKVHGYQSSCNRFMPDKDKDREDARVKLARYIHYWTRFQNHQASLKNEKKNLVNEVKIKMEYLQQRCNMSWIEVQFLEDALSSLWQCRQTLMFSYPFAFYLIENNYALMFLDNQTNLEANTEKLSRLLEMDVCEWDLTNIKQSIINTSRYCKERRVILLKNVNEGFDSDHWKLSELD